MPKNYIDYRKQFKPIAFLMLLGILGGCAHESQISPATIAAVYRDTPIQVELSASKQPLHDLLQTTHAILDKKELNEQDITEIERLYAHYAAASALAGGKELRLLANSRLKIDLPSYCLDPFGTVPARREPFSWKRENPGIPYYSKIVELVSRAESLTQENAQELIWNLKSKANYEDYPPHLRKVLDQIDPNAKFTRPSRIKRELKDAAKNVARETIPGFESAEDALSATESRYYDYSEITDALRRRSQPTGKSQQETVLSRLQSKPGVYALVESDGYSKQGVSFFNTNGTTAHIDLSEYLLKPLNPDVQRIGLSMQAGLGHEVLSKIEAALKDAIIGNAVYWYAGQLTPEEALFIKDHPIEALYCTISSSGTTRFHLSGTT